MIKLALSSLTLLLLLQQGYGQVRQISFEVDNNGFRIKVPSDGLRMVAFHVNVNEPLVGTNVGKYNVDVTQSTGGFFTLHIDDMTLNDGDTVYYWVTLISLSNQGEHVTDKQWTYHKPTPTPAPTDPPTQQPPTSAGTTKDPLNPSVSFLPTAEGFNVFVSDNGYTTVALNLNVDKPLSGMTPGDWNKAAAPVGGTARFEYDQQQIEAGSTVYYWLLIIMKDGSMVHVLDQSYTFRESTTHAPSTTSSAGSGQTTTADPKNPPVAFVNQQNGFDIYIRDYGYSTIAINLNVDKPLAGMEPGDWSKGGAAVDGVFHFFYDKQAAVVGTTVYYRLLLIMKDGSMVHVTDQSYTFPVSTQKPSGTTSSGGGSCGCPTGCV